MAGTSAGGINGICLAKAAMRDSSQDGLTDLWMSKGDIRHLMRFGVLGRHRWRLHRALASSRTCLAGS